MALRIADTYLRPVRSSDLPGVKLSAFEALVVRDDGESVGMRRPGEVAAIARSMLGARATEAFLVIALDARYAPICAALVSMGTVASAPVHPREIFGLAVRVSAAAVIVAHNHPSGDLDPSSADVAVTERLVRAGQVVGVPLLDHMIVGPADAGWYSFRDKRPSVFSVREVSDV